MTESRLHQKIKKLLALAADPAASPNEAETAARQAAFLMTENDIDMSDLCDADLKASWDMTTMSAQGHRPGNPGGTTVPSWIGIIAWGVRAFTRTRCNVTGNKVMFKGPREDVVLSVWLHETLMNGAYKASMGRDKSAAIQFRNGFATALQGRLMKMAEERDKVDAVAYEGSSGTSLVRVHDSREQEMIAEFGEAGSGKKGKQLSSSVDGYVAGTKHAIPLHRPIGSSSQRLLA